MIREIMVHLAQLIYDAVFQMYFVVVVDIKFIQFIFKYIIFIFGKHEGKKNVKYKIITKDKKIAFLHHIRWKDKIDNDH